MGHRQCDYFEILHTLFNTLILRQVMSVELMIPRPKTVKWLSGKSAAARYAETWVRIPDWSFFSL